MTKRSVFKKTTLALLCTAFIAAAPLAAQANDPHGSAPAKNPVEAMRFAVKGNNDFTAKHDKSYFEPFQKGQAPKLAVVACADSRVQTDLFGSDPTNNIFMIRNIGNQVATAEGSVDYGVRHMPTSVLMVMGHSSCGAIKAAMGEYASESSGIKRELDTLAEPIKADDKQGDFDSRWAKNIERNVDYQVAVAQKQYADKIKSGELVIVGAVYDFNDFYGQGPGTLVVTNVDGETNPEKIKAHKVMKDLTGNQGLAHVGNMAPETDFSGATALGYHPADKK